MIMLPKNLLECFEALKVLVHPTDLNGFKNEPERDANTMAHFGLGRWIRNTWGLWEKGPLYVYFKETFGLDHADDMSSVILTSFHRHLNQKELYLDKQVLYYREYWENENVVRVRPEGT